MTASATNQQTKSGALGALTATVDESAAAGGTSLEDDQNYQFYKEYCRLYYANIILTNRLQ